MSAKVTIGRRTNQDNEGSVSISIEDRESGLKVVEVEMSLIDFAQTITGLACCDAEYRFKPSQSTVDNIGKTREIKDIFVGKVDGVYDRGKRNALINKSIKDSGELVDGWALHDDGTRSQQNGLNHKVVLKRFV
jgi:hypothetical protein